MHFNSSLGQCRPCWANTIAASPHVQGAPERGRTDAIGPWLEANGIPEPMCFFCLVW